MDEEALAGLVRERAGHCCEYCQLPQRFSSTRFQIDHIIPEQHGGKAVLSNLALACLADNNQQVGVTTVGKVRGLGGDVIPSPRRKNPSHAMLSGLTPEQASNLFRPTVKNPSRTK